MQITHIYPSLLLSDWLFLGVLVTFITTAIIMQRIPHLRETWHQVSRNRLGMAAFIILIFYFSVATLDSIHFDVTYYNSKTTQTSIEYKSLLDLIIKPIHEQTEITYSAPFSIYYHMKQQRLKYGGAHLSSPNQKNQDITSRIVTALLITIISFLIIAGIFFFLLSLKRKENFGTTLLAIVKGKTNVAWREMALTALILWILIGITASLASHYHILGTDKIGNDVFYESLKSIRTGLLIGTLTTLFMLPFALLLGTASGYFGGWIDDFIQYIYTTLSSIPGVLLIAASVLMLQVFIANHPEWFPTLIERADARLIALCFILGITSWANLCRLLRAETLKLRELEYVQAAITLGSSQTKIILKHILPNVFHIILITIVLDFSGLVLAEAVLSYVGVGVDPTTISWGNMINSSRLELAREPAVWWPLLGALIFMFFLVLSANIFSDAVRDAFDPKLREISKE